VSQLFLAKELDGAVATFLRFDGEEFIVQVNGVERSIPRDVWQTLPERRIDHDRDQAAGYS
jgi:hypothetical protein